MILYYFSGTGNSLQLAKDFAAQIQEISPSKVQLVSIAKVLSGQTEKIVAPECFGLFFPVYAWGLPGIVVRFLEQLQLTGNEYVFALATCGGGPGGTLLQLDRLLKGKGAVLSAGFAITMPDNYIVWMGAKEATLRDRILEQAQRRLPEIGALVIQKGRRALEGNNRVYNFFSHLVYHSFRKMSGTQARNFWSNSSCTGCGMCVRICPTGNINLVEGKPSWGNQCEQCMACIQWCPTEAIQYKKSSMNKKRYQHPAIKPQELFVRE